MAEEWVDLLARAVLRRVARAVLRRVAQAALRRVGRAALRRVVFPDGQDHPVDLRDFGACQTSFDLFIENSVGAHAAHLV